MINAPPITMIMPINIGITAAMIDNIVDVTSSAILTGTLPAPPVVAVTAGLTASDLTV
jgi:hypothetical protein